MLDVASASVSLEGVTIRNCSGTAILLRAERFRMTASVVEDCDVGIDIAENASRRCSSAIGLLAIEWA